MNDIFLSGLQWLARKQRQFVSSPVIYCRDGAEYPVNAVLGRTSFEIVDENGFRLESHAADFLIDHV